ncbi:DUF2849 domain-containing protein [Notoacmeibacter ruber]|uniref:DUF2849 domain-containing protein n=1 Tax=Notoacmeibacter ruber TaxID=2670375 RepID=UPI001FE1CC05|nr:DUF2849 domain-containing protein [Notoacmeibacter ruber]
MALKVLTANRLTDGEVVYFNQEDGWIHTLSNASVGSDEETVAALNEAGAASAARNEVVDVNLIDVFQEGSALRPARLREIIRAAGPTTHPEFAR